MSFAVIAKHRCALVLMARVPVAGAVESLLSPPLTPEEAAALTACFLRDMAANIAEIVNTGSAEGVIMFTPPGAGPSLKEIIPSGFKVFPQRGERLGERLSNATEDLLNRGFHSVCLINSQTPTLPRSMIEDAVTALNDPGDHLVLGTATEGGYCLIGAKKPHPQLFERIAWTTADVFAHTSTRAAEMGLKLKVLPHWYNVDGPKMLNRLCQELFVPARQVSSSGRRERAYAAPYTRRFLTKLIEKEGPQRICPEVSL
jgi:rSAM/selenodomain-associated transferase 1